MRIKEAAEALKVSYWSVLRWAIAKKIPANKIGGRWVVSKAWVTEKCSEMRELEQG